MQSQPRSEQWTECLQCVILLLESQTDSPPPTHFTKRESDRSEERFKNKSLENLKVGLKNDVKLISAIVIFQSQTFD